jgi:hypothetical protein
MTARISGARGHGRRGLERELAVFARGRRIAIERQIGTASERIGHAARNSAKCVEWNADRTRYREVRRTR